MTWRCHWRGWWQLKPHAGHFLFIFVSFVCRGAGQEVGRSCIMIEFKGKKIMVSDACVSRCEWCDVLFSNRSVNKWPIFGLGGAVEIQAGHKIYVALLLACTLHATTKDESFSSHLALNFANFNMGLESLEDDNSLSKSESIHWCSLR